MESERKHEVCSHIANLFDVWHPKMRPESGMPFQFSGFTEFQLFSWLKTWWSGPNLNLKRKGPQIPWGLHWICCFCDQQNVRKQKILFPIHRFYRIPTWQGVTKKFEYKMRLVYAHFPINTNIVNGGKVRVESEMGYFGSWKPPFFPHRIFGTEVFSLGTAGGFEIHFVTSHAKTTRDVFFFSFKPWIPTPLFWR